MKEMSGASFTAATSKVNSRVEVKPLLSVAVTTTWLVPNLFRLPAMVTWALSPETVALVTVARPAVGVLATTAVMPVTVPSRSPTVKVAWPTPSSLIRSVPIGPMVGAG